MSRASISAFFPAYNDGKTIGDLVRKTLGLLPSLTDDYEVIVINDGSSDDTAQVLAELQSAHPERLRVVTHLQNRGYGGALRSGFAAATKDLVFYTDGDAQYDPLELEQLVQKMRPSVGVVNGFKITRNDPWHRVAIGWLYNRFARFIFGIQLRDIDCDFRLIRRELLEELSLRSTSGTICVELVKKLELCPYLVEEVGVSHYPRLHGKSQFFRIQSLASTFFQLIRLYVTLVVMPQMTGRDVRTA
ncbi:MAG TPA: glycosyltransferase family 2 protein [Bryobacteraceae bacterium]|nr:glycosyltransferase family 2 protein [Bryobacteraceae bacterium]